MRQEMTRRCVALCMAVAAFTLQGCGAMLVQPHDEVLLDHTESLFKKASTMINDGVGKSPRTDAERARFKDKPAEHPAHLSQFEARYDELGSDADALILRALARSQKVSPAAQVLERKIEDLIEKNIPSSCPELDAEFDQMSAGLTVRNYIDLRCLLTRWKAQHGDDRVTDATGIMKRINWELRRSTLFAAVLAIQKAELAKTK